MVANLYNSRPLELCAIMTELVYEWFMKITQVSVNVLLLSLSLNVFQNALNMMSHFELRLQPTNVPKYERNLLTYLY